MRAVKEDTDYRIFLTWEEIKKACTRSVTSLSELERFYPWLYAKVIGSKVNEVVALCCTIDAFYVGCNNPNTHDNIHFEFDEENQPTIRVYTPTLASLLHDKDHLVTRYSAESKIWIHRDDVADSRL